MRRKVFACGHKGLGKFCHTCRQQEVRRTTHSRLKKEWHHRIQGYPINLDEVPEQTARKVMTILDRLTDGVPYRHLKGKQLRHHGRRRVVSIPVGHSYRLICERLPHGIAPLEVMSHQKYDGRISQGGW